jgi:hypothetical protein
MGTGAKKDVLSGFICVLFDILICVKTWKFSQIAII